MRRYSMIAFVIILLLHICCCNKKKVITVLVLCLFNYVWCMSAPDLESLFSNGSFPLKVTPSRSECGLEHVDCSQWYPRMGRWSIGVTYDIPGDGFPVSGIVVEMRTQYYIICRINMLDCIHDGWSNAKTSFCKGFGSKDMNIAKNKAICFCHDIHKIPNTLKNRFYFYVSARGVEDLSQSDLYSVIRADPDPNDGLETLLVTKMVQLPLVFRPVLVSLQLAGTDQPQMTLWSSPNNVYAKPNKDVSMTFCVAHLLNESTFNVNGQAVQLGEDNCFTGYIVSGRQEGEITKILLSYQEKAGCLRKETFLINLMFMDRPTHMGDDDGDGDPMINRTKSESEKEKSHSPKSIFRCSVWEVLCIILSILLGFTCTCV